MGDNMREVFVICNHEGCYWNNSFGWTEFKGEATRFNYAEKTRLVSLPMGGEWISLTKIETKEATK